MCCRRIGIHHAYKQQRLSKPCVCKKEEHINNDMSILYHSTVSTTQEYEKVVQVQGQCASNPMEHLQNVETQKLHENMSMPSRYLILNHMVIIAHKALKVTICHQP